MSVGLKAARYGIAAVVVAGIIITSSFFYLGAPTQLQGGTSTSSKPPVSSTSSTSFTSPTSSKSGVLGTSQLVIQLTDPPQVPELTSSLNMTYTSLSVLVGEPSGHQGQLNTTTLTITPSGGNATLELLRLQNVSQTLGTMTLPNDSVIYSVTFTISSIKIDVNGTLSAVTLAGGATTLTVTMANPHELWGTNVALLQLNPVVVQTPAGYELIPSSVGVIRYSEGEGEGQTGSFHQLDENDTEALENVYGNVTATLNVLSVSGNSTTITVEVKNTGNGSVVLNAIGIHGNFTAVGQCENGDSHDNGSDGSNSCHGHEHDHPTEVVFVPVDQTVSGAACANLTMQLVNGDFYGHEEGGLTLAQGQCADLAFSGVISFGDSNQTLVPSTTAGQVYDVHVIASNGANMGLTCTLPAGPSSCTVQQQENDDGHDLGD
jgi:hypothetical protein